MCICENRLNGVVNVTFQWPYTRKRVFIGLYGKFLYSSGLKVVTSLISTLHYAEFSHMSLPNYKGDRDMSCGPWKKDK